MRSWHCLKGCLDLLPLSHPVTCVPLSCRPRRVLSQCRRELAWWAVADGSRWDVAGPPGRYPGQASVEDEPALPAATHGWRASHLLPTIGCGGLSPASRAGPCLPLSLWSGGVLTGHSSGTSGWRLWGALLRSTQSGGIYSCREGHKGATCLLVGVRASTRVRDCKPAVVWPISFFFFFFLIQFKSDSKSLSHWTGKTFGLRQHTPQSRESISCFSRVWTKQTQGRPLLFLHQGTLLPFFQSQSSKSATQLSSCLEASEPVQHSY